ncbi:MAG: hypothetical protein AB7N99_02695 [Simkaniaceae bacterium]
MSFGMAGALFGETPFNSLFNLFNWRITFLDLALFGFILALIYWTFVRDRASIMAYQVQPTTPTIPFKKALVSLFKNKQNWFLFFYRGLAWTTITVFAGFWGTPFLKIK